MLYYQLTRWLAFRRIKHPQFVWLIHWLPWAFSMLATLIYYLVMGAPGLTGSDGLLLQVAGMAAFLPGFFVAALAAVATFDRPGLDHEMEPPAPRVTINDGTGSVEIDLTYRMYISYLFSYLSIGTIFLIVLCVVMAYSNSVVGYEFFGEFIEIEILSWKMFDLLKLIFILMFFYSLGSIFIVMLHGVYFLMERVHQIANE